MTGMFNKMDASMTNKAFLNMAEKEQQDFLDVEDILEQMKENGDYSMLPLAIICMHDLTPFDLRSFFENFSDIEEVIFKKKSIVYEGMTQAYTDSRYLLESKYVDFAVKYYNISSAYYGNKLSEMQEEEKSFIITRFQIVQSMLLEIGKRLNTEYYKDIIV